MLPVILTAAGSDPSGGAGVQADLLTIAATGGYGASAITAITVQNSRGLRSVSPVDPDLVREQMEAIFSDMPVASVKTGMLVDAEVVLAVSGVLKNARLANVVVDPVMGPTRGESTMVDTAVEALRKHLMPLTTLLTPNVPELERLTGKTVRSVNDAILAGRSLLDQGPEAILVKGGHLAGAPATDLLLTASETSVLPGTWLEQPHSHGTGCVLSAAIATYLGSGNNLSIAVDRARSFLAGALKNGRAHGSGPGSVNPLFRGIDPAVDGKP